MTFVRMAVEPELPERFKLGYASDDGKYKSYQASMPRERICYQGHTVHGWWDSENFNVTVKQFANQESGVTEFFVESSSDGGTECHTCGQRMRYHYNLERDSLETATACEDSEGGITVVDFEIPSGKLVMADSLGEHFDLGPYPKGRKMHQERMEELVKTYGMVHFPVGNCSPDFYRTEVKGRYVVANYYAENLCDAAGCVWPADATECSEHPEVPHGWEKLGGVCTDLWGVSLMDYELWLTAPEDKRKEARYVEVAEIPAGRYRVTYHGTEKDFDIFNAEGELPIFATIEYLGSV